MKLYPYLRCILILVLTSFSYTFIQAQSHKETTSNKELTNNIHKGLYPMPASDFVNIIIPKVSESTIIHIIDLAGNVVASRSTIYNQVSTFDLSNIKAGFYMVKLFNNNENTKIYKLVIQ